MSDDPATQRLSKRLTEGLDGVSERIDTGFASIRGAIDGLGEHMRKMDARTRADLEAQATALRSGLGQVEIGVGELRDRVKHLEDTTLPQQAAMAAEGAARGAGQAAGIVAAETAKITAAQTKGFLSTWFGKVVAWSIGFAALVAGGAAIPTAAKGLTKVWLFLTGLK
jgi:hypothetical protein